MHEEIAQGLTTAELRQQVQDLLRSHAESGPDVVQRFRQEAARRARTLACGLNAANATLNLTASMDPASALDCHKQLPRFTIMTTWMRNQSLSQRTPLQDAGCAGPEYNFIQIGAEQPHLTFEVAARTWLDVCGFTGDDAPDALPFFLNGAVQ